MPSNFLTLLLPEGYAEAVESLDELRVDFIEALFQFLFTRGGVVGDSLEVDGGYVEVCPVRGRQSLPISESLEPEVKQPVRLTFEVRDEAHGLFGEAGGYDICVYVGCEAILILRVGGFVDNILIALRCAHKYIEGIKHCLPPYLYAKLTIKVVMAENTDFKK